MGWVARFTRGYWRACSAIGLSHETASFIVATVPELLLSPARRQTRVTGLATTTVEEEGASTLALRQARPRIGLSSPYVVFCN